MMKYLFVLLCVISVCAVIAAHPTPDNSSEEPVSLEEPTPNRNVTEPVNLSSEEIEEIEPNGKPNESTEKPTGSSTPQSPVDQG